MEQTVVNFLNELKVPISKKYVEKLIASHPNFPSLLSISDTLERLGIRHAAGRVVQNNLKELAYPYLVVPHGESGEIILIKNKNDFNRHESKIGASGSVVLQAEPSRQTKDKSNNDFYLKDVHIRNLSLALLIIFVALISPLIINSFSLIPITLLVTTLLGALLGYIILAKEMGMRNAAIEDFCNSGKNINCDKVLNVKISLFGVKVSDAVFIYFVFEFVALLIAIASPKLEMFFIQILAVLSATTIPIILLSLYYQYFVAKVWCRLCLAVVAILFIQFLIFTTIYLTGGFPSFSDFSFFILFTLLMVLAGICLCVLLIKSLVERLNELGKIEIHGSRFKYSISIFTHILFQQRKFDDAQFESEVLLGPPGAAVKIIMVSNLNCRPCKAKYEIIGQLIAMYPEKVSIYLRFIGGGTAAESATYLLTYWNESIRGKDDEFSKTASLIHDWYELGDLRKFKNKYLVTNVNIESSKLFEKHSNWAKEVGITQTPTFIINGYELPKEYKINDLLSIIPALEEASRKK